jgi:copper chaperone
MTDASSFSAAATDATASADSTDAITTEYGVLGMTCAHCVASVSEEVGEIAGVREVTVDLTVGGASTVIVTSATALDPAVVRAAVTEAGYELVSASA